MDVLVPPRLAARFPFRNGQEVPCPDGQQQGRLRTRQLAERPLGAVLPRPPQTCWEARTFAATPAGVFLSAHPL